MLKNQGHILTDDIVINYKNRDRDDCLHFLTHIDTTCKDLSLFISPTAKRIYTSIFNAWFLKMNFDVKHIDVHGFSTNKSFKITYKGNKYIYSFIESKFTTGSVALLLHGSFGTYLYTGNFCYYPSFLRSPVLLPVIEEKALTRLYLDNTYYEQPSNFLGFHELATKVAALIKSQPMKNFYIYADKVTMDPLLADIASKLEERVYVCQSTMEIMKILGYESCFTRHSNESRIFIDKAFIKKRGFGLENIAIYINRYSESCKSFQKIEKKGNVYTFNFYCHSNHREICELLRILKPESMTFLFSEIDKSKLSYDFKFKYDFPRNVLFNGISTEASNKVESETNMLVKNIPRQLIKPSITIDKVVHQFSGNEGKNLVQSTSENRCVTNLSKDFICPLRIRKVPEINNTGLSNGLNCIIEGVTDNITCNKLSYIGTNEINNYDSHTSNFSAQSYASVKSFHNYHKPQPSNSVEFIKLANNDSTENTLISSNINSFSSCVVKTKTGVPLVFNSKLVKENRLTETNPKGMPISNVGMSSVGKKNTIVLNRKYVDVKKPYVVTVPVNGIQKTKLNDVENVKHIVIKKPLMLLKSKTADSDSNMKRPNALLQPPSDVLDLTKLFHGWMDNDMTSISKNSSQTSENIIDEHEESISVGSYNCDRDSIQLKSPRNNTSDNNRNSDSLGDTINLQNEHNINQSCETLAEFHLKGNQQSCNEKNNGDDSIITAAEKSLVNNRATGGSPCKSTNGSGLKPVNANTLENNKSEFCKNDYQAATNTASNTISKRHLADDENGQLRKKLRSDNLRKYLMQSWQQNEPLSLRDCRILIRRNSFEKSYFYSSKHDCYLPKFYGFRKHEVRPRNLLNTLRNLQKLVMEINYN
ncbi:unnamed protein product [Nezara viridula]|uniref:Uncharacterized protein n=1 Tax=Nezara viridula TaxID=85310 RepID=A0A9P0MWR5_NEZVI|nr:unnamed protein product [Nezara viridula]